MEEREMGQIEEERVRDFNLFRVINLQFGDCTPPPLSPPGCHFKEGLPTTTAFNLFSVINVLEFRREREGEIQESFTMERDSDKDFTASEENPREIKSRRGSVSQHILISIGTPPEGP